MLSRVPNLTENVLIKVSLPIQIDEIRNKT